jgi:hypothetical protein
MTLRRLLPPGAEVITIYRSKGTIGHRPTGGTHRVDCLTGELRRLNELLADARLFPLDCKGHLRVPWPLRTVEEANRAVMAALACTLYGDETALRHRVL